MNTIQALQGLYVALGGELTDTYEDIAGGVPVSDYKVIPDMIEAISQKASGGSSLPTVDATDNGKLLTVVEGNWDKANVDGAKIYDITYVGNRYNLPSGVQSKNIYAECDAGVNVILRDSNKMLYKYIGKNAGYHVFNAVYEDLAGSKVYVETIWADNSNNTYLLNQKTQIAKA